MLVFKCIMRLLNNIMNALMIEVRLQVELDLLIIIIIITIGDLSLSKNIGR